MIRVVVLSRSMKTITLTDEACDRLVSWKEGTKDSFSKVVLRVVLKRGTLADLAEQFEKLPPLTEEQAKLMVDAAAWANDWRNWGRRGGRER